METSGQKFKGTGGQILVETLARNGVERISCVAGESYLPVLDALLEHPEIAVVTCRQEGGAGFIAESWGKLSGRPGICMVTRGPGICNASIAIHTAKQDSTPMIVFMGQVRRWERGREAFQEVDVRAVFGTLAKWATEIDDPSRIPEIVNYAFQVATTGRPGPVVIGLPEDMLSEMAEAVLRGAAPVIKAVPQGGDLEKALTLLQAAQHPMVIVGGSGWTEDGLNELAGFARLAHLPVMAAFRNHDLFDHRHGCYAGELGTGPNPALVERVKAADLLLVIGSRLDEITTQNYTLIDHQKLIHIHQDAAEIGKVYHPALAIHADVNAAATALAGMAFTLDGRGWAGWRDAARKDYTDWIAIDPENRPAFSGADMTLVFHQLRGLLPADAIVTTDAGNFSGWAQRYLQYGRPGRLLAPISGAMGYSVPSAIGASIANPDRVVLGLCGDGGFMMNGQEFATAMHHGAKPVIMVCNNGMYGTIRMHQEKKYPGRVSATSLTNPDFVALAKSYGAYAARVEDAADFGRIWAEALASGTIALIEIRMDPRQITTRSA
ncbi:MAG: thiamine pyrophosphate-binding protein [Micavibrio aeruginosavorus]|nr:thiamine pyrophosphate-binding protein [Micavibrio aeruginosavorus]